MKKRILIIAAILAASLLYHVQYNGAISAPGGEELDFFHHIIKRNSSDIAQSGQLIFVVNRDPRSYRARMYTLERIEGQWRRAFKTIDATIGSRGFAVPGKKREGDRRTPTGIYALGTAFGYRPAIATGLNYRMVTQSDFWVDDVNSDQYNTWVHGKPRASSYERLKRGDNQYKYGIVVEYNTDPIVRGKGSAIFVHVFRDPNRPTAGCIAIAERDIIEILRWLDIRKKPLIILGSREVLLRY
jgi:L,D-peptidoglycan transpeptidase YkuD (ErfK/YbiS/YcfS/YnhG family)